MTGRRPFRTPGHHPGPPAPALDFASWVVWQDEHLLAVNKPAGVLSQGGPGAAGINVVDLARGHLGIESVGVLHRIDRNVSGLVLIAKTARAARGLSIAIQRGQVERVYAAVVRGDARGDAFVVDAPLSKDPARNEVRAAWPEELAGFAPQIRQQFKPARTEVRVVHRFRGALGPCAELEVRPVTGRSHQIRVHLALVGLPILGDPKYGVAVRGLNRPLLHARALGFRHPIANDLVTIECPIPWDIRALPGLRDGH